MLFTKRTLYQVLLYAIVIIVGHVIAYKIVHIPPQHELVLIVSLLLFYPVVKYPLFGLYSFFVLSPFIPFIRRLYYLAYQRPTADPLIILSDLLIVLIMVGLFFEFRERQETSRPLRIVSAALVIYFIYICIRTFVYNHLPLSVSLLRLKFYAPPVLLFFIGTIFATKINHLKNFWMITIVIGLLSGLYGIKQLYIGYSEFEKIWFSSIQFSTLFIKGIARPFSFFQSPAAFGDYQQLAVIGILMLTIWKPLQGRLFSLLGIPLLTYATLITSVRSNWIGMIICVVFWLTLLKVHGLKTRLLLLTCLSLAFVGFIYFEESFSSGLNFGDTVNIISKGTVNQKYINLLVTERASALSNPFEEHSFLSRVALWKYVILGVRDPVLAVLGSGIGSLNSDSLYITYLAELGIPGALFIISIVLFFIVSGFKIIDKTTSPSILALAKAITAMNLTFAIINITGTHIHSFPGDAYFWFWNGVLIKIATMDPAMLNEIAIEGGPGLEG